MNILDLPSEIIFYIYDHLFIIYRRNFALSCRRCFDVLPSETIRILSLMHRYIPINGQLSVPYVDDIGPSHDASIRFSGKITSYCHYVGAEVDIYKKSEIYGRLGIVSSDEIFKPKLIPSPWYISMRPVQLNMHDWIDGDIPADAIPNAIKTYKLVWLMR